MKWELTTEAFADAVSKGKGRAVLAIQPPVSPEFRAIILDSCLNDPRYDRQLENCRVDQIMEMVDRAKMREEALQSLLAQHVEPESDASTHRFRMLGHFAQTDSQVETLLKNQAQSGELDATEALVDHGYLEWVIEHVLPTIPEDESWRLKYWKEDHPDLRSPLVEQLDAAIQEAEAKQPEYHPPEREQLTFEEILAQIKEGGKRVRGFRYIAESLSSAQIEEVAELWLTEQRRRQGIDYADLFEYVDFPLPVSQIIDLYRAGKSPIWFHEVLSYSQDPLAREFGRDLVSKDPPDHRGYKCMASSWEDGDMEFMAQQLSRFEQLPPDESHGLAIDFLGDFTNWAPEESRPFMLWIYEFNPCSYCRGRAAERLLEAGCLPDEYREELAFDSDPEARKLVNVCQPSC